MAPFASLWTGIASNYPIFIPPDDAEGGLFSCEYPSMVGWKSCNTKTNRSCWLSGPNNETYDIYTDYETKGPKGVIREYYLEVQETMLNPDGIKVPWGLTFNGTYPGPRLRACWGDQLRITVSNTLSLNNTNSNGTTIHWHGLRQWNTGWSDGVNGVTQCPIAPTDTFTYVFNATQYGTTWYHSHYSLQYANGLLAPLTIYGPSSKNYSEQKYPLIMTDWNHDRSGMKYLLRLINAATATTYVFSIDNHKFWVIEADFVPIEPYQTDHIVVGIGQRYNIIVEAIPEKVSPGESYWIRTTPALLCNIFPDPKPDSTTGIVRYSLSDEIPTTQMGNFTADCIDETYTRNLTPIVHWQVKGLTYDLPIFNVSFQEIKGYPYWPCNESVGRLELIQGHPLWLNFSNATLLNLNANYSQRPWLAEVTTPSLSETWVKAIIMTESTKENPTLPRPLPDTPGLFAPRMHPMHLHGHDFALLAQCVPESQNSTNCDLSKAVLNLDNPPRRDVAFLPDGGYLIIAFKADNPGVWLLHCHIAFHASSGLALQIIENKENIKMPDSVTTSLYQMCQNWNSWKPDNASDPCMCAHPGVEPLQQDSGI
ncbi:laccase-like multicopper oxidase [Glonium stellatum]|uniref:Laccase-like multicopper oxidase n=1 Tax=Glonium stellatum TaxID=574774 RepID=A0A8E2F4L5_9PEZI|nr:laccase-like multicopper oxidase [Glonium stellatum]